MALGVPAVLGTPYAVDTTAASSWTITGISPTAGRVLTVETFGRKSTSGAPAADLTIAISGSATWSWTRQQVQNNQTNRHTLAVFRATVPTSPGTGLTITITSDQACNRRGIIVWEQSAADVNFYGLVMGESALATPALTLGIAPAAGDYKVGVIASVGDSNGVDPGDTAAMTELHDTNPTPVTATTLQDQYRTGVTTTGVDWKNCATTSNLMIAWIVKEVVTASLDLVARAQVSVGDTNYTAESAALTPGRHVIEVRISQADDEIGIRVDGGTEVVTSTTGTHNAQSAIRYVGARIVDGAPQSDTAAAALNYEAAYNTIPTGDALLDARAAAAATIKPKVTPPVGLGVGLTGTTNISLVPYVQDPSGAGWSVGSVSAVGATAAIGSNPQTIDLSSVTVGSGGVVSVTVRVDNAMASAVRGSTTFGFSCLAAAAGYSNGYAYRRRWLIPADRVSGSGSFSGFVVRLKRQETWLRPISAGGEMVYADTFLDIRFETEGGAELPYKVLRYEPATGLLIVELRIASLSGSADNRAWMYYGRNQPFSTQSSATYQDYLAAVDTTTGLDLSPNERHFDIAPGVTSGLIDGVPSGQALGVGALRREDVSWLTGLSAITVEMWVDADAASVNTNDGPLGQGPFNAADQDHGIILRHAQTGFRGGAAQPWIWSVLTSAGVARLESSALAQSSGPLHIIASWADGQLPKLWINGVPNTPSWVGKIVAGVATENATITGTTLAGSGVMALFASAWDAATGGWAGLIGPVRLRALEATDDYVATVYAMESDNETFIGLGARDAAADSTAGPVAGPVATAVAVGGQIDVDVLAEAYDPDGTLTLVALDALSTSHGSADIVAGQVRYTNNGTGVEDRCGFTISDGSKTNRSVIKVSITGGTALPAAYDYEYGLPWALPASDDDIQVINVPATGNLVLPTGDNTTWDKVLLLVAPATPGTTLRITGTRIKYGGLIAVGFGFDWLGYGTGRFSEDNQGPWPGGNVWQVSHAAGSSSFMPAGRRPYVFMANTRFTAVASKWGDYWRGGTDNGTNAAPLNNPDDWNDFLLQKFKLSGHHNWDPPEDPTSGHSDVIQFPSGGSNNIIVCDADIEQNGLGLYTLDTGNIANHINRTKAPVNSQAIYKRISYKNIEFQSAAPRIDDGTFRCMNQSRSAAVWTMTDGRWRQMNIVDFKCALTAGQASLAGNFHNRFSTPNYPEPALVTQAGRTFARWTPATWQGKPTVIGDAQAELVALAALPERVPVTDTGAAWRITNIADLRAIFG